MRLEDILEVYSLISRGTENIPARKQAQAARKTVLDAIEHGTPITKVAFDTRRVDQESTYIPRRGLQNYHRSEQFVSEAIFQKVQAFDRLNKVLDQLKLEMGKEPEWHDSYTRVLSSAVQKGLRTEQLDGDFSDAQPSMASLAYLEELLYVRYRLTPDNLLSMSEDQLRKAILQKDELLLRKDSGVQMSAKQPEITPTDVSKFSYEQMMEKMMFSVANMMQEYKSALKQPSEHAPVESATATNVQTSSSSGDRTITITIKG